MITSVFIFEHTDITCQEYGAKRTLLTICLVYLFSILYIQCISL